MCVCVCVCACVVHLYCSAQVSMFNMEKRYVNKIIIINVMTMMMSKCLCFPRYTHDRTACSFKGLSGWHGVSIQ